MEMSDAPDGIPKVGDYVYIPTELYVSHGEDDYIGGRTTISSVRGGPDDSLVWIRTAFDDSQEWRWDVLKQQQAELAEEFGSTPPKRTPDFRAEFNRWDE